jgi:hypothetical protein
VDVGMSKQDTAQLIAGIAVGLMTLLLAIAGRRELIAQKDLTYEGADKKTHSISRGEAIRREDAARVDQASARWVRRSALGALLAGTDNRTSTSKTVVYAWTAAVAFGLLSLVVAIWLGDHRPWDQQVDRGLQEEYLLLLGGPFAAAVLAKYATSAQAATKTSAAPGDAAPSQLVTNDNGDADLGDFQYVLFNAIGLTFFLGDFIGDLGNGFPVLPPLLTGLLLTSTAGYSAKKFLPQVPPTLASVVPAAAMPGESVQVFGHNLTVLASVRAFVGGLEAQVTACDLVLGNDRLTVVVPPDAPPGSAPISVVRADGTQARDANGVTALPFDVLARPAGVDEPAAATPRA